LQAVSPMSAAATTATRRAVRARFSFSDGAFGIMVLVLGANRQGLQP